MASISSAEPIPLTDYPTGDGKPVGETPVHRDNLLQLIDLLRRHYRGDRSLYISGNMFIYFVRGDKRRHVSPDVFVALDVPDADRDAYFTWVEGKGPDFVVEFTSRTTRREDLEKKFLIYQDILRVREYFLFDPREEYLRPSMRGYRLVEGRYRPIEPVDGRLPSEATGLHLEREGVWLRLYDPATGLLIPTKEELADRAEEKADRAEEKARRAEEKARRAEEAARRAQEDAGAEIARLRAEIEELKRQRG